MLSACEPSGDALGAGLMAELRRMRPDVRFVGVGGPAMAAEGLRSLFDIAEMGFIGINEILTKIPHLLRRIRETAALALREKPDVAVVIDSGDFNHRVAKRIRAGDPSIPIVKYVSSQVWASRPGRTAKMPAFLDHVLCLLPFEPDFYKRYGLPATFVGHPAVERRALMTGGDELRRRLQISPEQRLLCVLPGSRRAEINLHLPVFRDAVAEVARHVPGLACVLPTVPAVEARVRTMTTDWPTPLRVLTTAHDRYAAFSTVEVALAASGTVATELAVAGVPMVVAYRVGWLSAAILRPLITVKHITIANILLDRRAIPELVQEGMTAPKIVDALLPLLLEPQVAAQQKADLATAVTMLRTDEGPSRRAAEAILDLLKGRSISAC